MTKIYLEYSSALNYYSHCYTSTNLLLFLYLLMIHFLLPYFYNSLKDGCTSIHYETFVYLPPHYNSHLSHCSDAFKSIGNLYRSQANFIISYLMSLLLC